MTREETKELLPIMEAYSKGKEIQIWDKSKSEWVDLDEDIFIAPPDKYRIKTEPKYRPFKNQEECWQEMQKHQPFGWVMRIEIGSFVHITSVQSTAIMFTDYKYIYENAFRYYKFPDGTPFGIKED